MGTMTGMGAGAEFRVSRRAKALQADGQTDLRPLADWRNAEAYVLLGDPGAGKSESFLAEARASDGLYRSARDFIALGIEPADASRMLFIDGLDEMRAGAPDGRVPLDAIRVRLESLGRPRFRLSCREHDWRVQTDLAALSVVARGGVVQELHLEPLSREEQLRVLQARRGEVPDAQGFLQRAEEHGLADLFGNPLLLDLTIRVVAPKGEWPDSRRAIYDLACRELATERSLAHLEAKPLEPGDVDRLLDDAGLLCAVLLLSGKTSLTRLHDAAASSIAWHTLPAALTMNDPGAALESKVFTTTAGASTPRHRSIAEYLAGQAIAGRLQQGLPLGRVLALMQGADGGIVEPLRGLLGWLAVHDARDRQHLIRLDPMSVALNGDVATFGSTDKHVLLEALRDEAQRNPWFRTQHWNSHPFAALATPEMADALANVLSDHSADPSQQALVNFVLNALNQGAPMPALRALIEAWVEDAAVWFDNRLDALSAWKRCTGFDHVKALEWLDQLHHGQIPDRDARLAGVLLLDLYPKHVGPEEVLRYWPKPGAVGTHRLLPRFWRSDLIKLSRPQDAAKLADAWLRMQPLARHPHHDSAWSLLRNSILAEALEQSGDQVSDEHLYAWLGIGVDDHGFSKLDRDEGGRRVAQWLTDRPQRMKAVVSLGWRATQPDAISGRHYFWEGEQRLHGAWRPRDWLHWLLQQAADAPNGELARYCFGAAARAIIDPPPGFDVPRMEQIEAWVEAHNERWPQAREWLLAEWSSRLEDNWQSDEYRRRRKQEAQALANKEARRKALAPHLDAIVDGTAPALLMHQLADAHEERFYDIRGETPEQRVQDFLAADEATARAAIAGLKHVLERDDLPTADAVLGLDAKGKYHHLRPAALLAARLAHEREPCVVHEWPDSLLATLVACWLTDGMGDMPGWYSQAAASRPSVVAPLLVRHSLRRLRCKGPLFVTGLWALSHEPGHAALARLVLPPLLEGFPQRASEPARRELNRSLLAGLHLLDDDTASAIVRRKLDNTSIDATQRICWLVADLPYRTDAARHLVDAVGKSERRAVALGIALHEQGSLARTLERVAAETLSRLIELLASITHPEWPLESHWVAPVHERGDTIRALVNLLAGDPQPGAATELQRLIELPRLEPWRALLRYSVLSQQGVARETYYVHPSPEAAALTLANRAPANRADLMALTLDHLRDIERHLRGADTFALRQFWRAGGDRAMSPKDENECRDLLLERLRDRLAPLGVHVESERRAADDKRADLRLEVTAKGKPLAVPIEIKKEDNNRLWLAWRDQLQALYAIDPAADGHGIYLILWFGHKPRSSPGGERPAGAAALEQLLTERVPWKDRARLAVLVLDLSLPHRR
jgi:hypothetical protein